MVKFVTSAELAGDFAASKLARVDAKVQTE